MMDHRLKPETQYAILIGFLALLMRLGHLLMLRNDPVADVMMLDSWSYDRLARLILQDSLPKKVYFQAPLYPYFLAAIYRLTSSSIDAVRIIQMVLDSVSAACVFRMTRCLLNRRAAIVAGIGFAVYPVLIFESGLILKTTLTVFFAAVMLWLVFETRIFSPGIRMLLLGLAGGWGAATQGSVLLQIPLIVLWIFISSGWNHPRAWLNRVGWFTIGLAIAIGPFTLRNYLTSRRFVLLTSQGGANLYLGNSPYSDGTSRRPPHIRMTPEHEEEDFHREAERQSGRSLTPEEASLFWRDQAIQWIKSNPADAVKLQARKFGLFWNRVEIPDNFDFDFYRRYSVFIRYPRYPFWIVGSLGILGMMILISSWRRTWFLYIWTISYCMIWVTFHIYSRYRLPMVVFLFPFAAGAIDRMIGFATRRSIVKLVSCSILLAGAAGFQALPLTGYSHAQPLFNLGVGLTRIGKIEDARNAYLEALNVLPEYEPAMVNLGKLAWAQGKRSEAAAWWEKALTVAPESAEAHSNLGTHRAMEGKMEEARMHFMAATANQPYYFLGWLHLAQAEESLMRFGDALKAFDRALELQPASAQALYGRAGVLDALQQRESAINAWKQYLRTAAGLPEEKEYILEANRRLALLSKHVSGSADMRMEPDMQALTDESTDQGGASEYPAKGMQ